MKNNKYGNEEISIFSIRLPRKTVIELQRIANKKGISRTRVILDAIKYYLEKQSI